MTFFHGTDADLQVGDILVPGSTLGVSANHGRSEHVYMTCDNFTPQVDSKFSSYEIALKEAYSWARTACMVAEDEREDEFPQAYVYIVEPLGEVEADGSLDEGVGLEAVRTNEAKIIGIIDNYDLYEFCPPFGSTYLNL